MPKAFVNAVDVDSPSPYYFATIDGYFIGIPGAGAVVASDINRETDVKLAAVDGSPEQLDVSPLVEDEITQRLFDSNDSYKRDAPYWPTPAVGTLLYNSSSFLRGLLHAAGVPEPRSPIIFSAAYPGWTNPIPLEHFK